MSDNPSARELSGVAMIVGACALVAGTTLIAKMLGINDGDGGLSPFQITWGRYFFAFTALAVYFLLFRPTIVSPNVRLHLVRVVFGVSGVTFMFAAATLIPLADATAITFLNPIVALVIAALFLGERAGRLRWVLAIFAFVGALLLIRPGAESFQPAALLALAAALLIGMEVVAVKRLSDTEPSFQILAASNVFGSVLATLVVLFVWQWPTFEQWTLLALLGVTMLSAQALYIPALRRGDASFIVPFTYSTLLFAALLDFVVFSVIPTGMSIAGAAIILISGISLAAFGGSRRSRDDVEGLRTEPDRL